LHDFFLNYLVRHLYVAVVMQINYYYYYYLLLLLLFGWVSMSVLHLHDYISIIWTLGVHHQVHSVVRFATWRTLITVSFSGVTRVFGARGQKHWSAPSPPQKKRSHDVGITQQSDFLLKVLYDCLSLVFLQSEWQIANLLQNCTESIHKRGNTVSIKAKYTKWVYSVLC